jgi:hypothetical protein
MWQKLKLYHGTDFASASSIFEFGVELSHSRTEDLDFGPGFYLTTNQKQAENWSGFVSRRRQTKPGLVTFELDRNDFHDLKSLVFTLEDCDPGYWAFVRHCRTETTVDHRCGNDLRYDMVIGPVAESWGKSPRTKPGCDQFSFHTEKAVKLLNTRRIKGVL